MTPHCSVIIPAHNHAPYLGAAIESALRQTYRTEAVVVDDGSTDATAALLATYARHPRVQVLQQAHRGPAAARNAGLEAATGDYVLFLDGDDTIPPDKVEKQLALRAPWVCSDITIVDEVKQRTENASDRYGYKDLALNGWISHLLAKQNLFPIHSPIVAREVVQDVRFDDPRFPEDWYFWHEVSRKVPCRYLPEALGTYYKRKTGRSRKHWPPRPVTPTIVRPLRLNLGCGNPKNESWHPLHGMINMDPYYDGWHFEDGLPEFPDGSVSGITISHALMFVSAVEWGLIFGECYRVLEKGGILRITEDHTGHPQSRTYQTGWRGSEPAVSLTTPCNVRTALKASRFQAMELGADVTLYRDHSLCQDWHGGAPHVFYVEGQK